MFRENTEDIVKEILQELAENRVAIREYFPVKIS